MELWMESMAGELRLGWGNLIVAGARMPSEHVKVSSES